MGRSCHCLRRRNRNQTPQGNLAMQIDPAAKRTRELYSLLVGLITPRPIAWVSTVSSSGVTNLAPYSFFNGVGARPPLVVFCPANRRDGSPKDTLANIQQNGQFVVNVVTDELAEVMNQTSAEYEPNVDEFEMTATAKAESIRVKPPRVAAAAAAFECELHQATQFGSGPGGANLVVGRIVWMHVADALFDEQGTFRGSQLCTIGRLGGTDYVRTSDRFELQRPAAPSSTARGCND